MPTSWLDLLLGWGVGSHPKAYDHLLLHIVDALQRDPAWQRWWSSVGVPVCELSLLLDDSEHFPPETSVKRGRKRIAASFVRAPAPFTTDDAAQLLPRASDEVLSMLATVRERFDLPELPPLRLPELPPDIPRGHVGLGPVAAMPPGLTALIDRAGGISPQGVVEYYRANPGDEGAEFWLQALDGVGDDDGRG